MQIKTGASLVAASEKTRSDRKSVLILGLGNVLLKDEGVGVHVAAELLKRDLPDNIEVIDGGTAGLDILLSEEGSYKLVVIDAIRDGKKPGTIYKTRLNVRPKRGAKYLAPQFIAGFSAGQSQISLHQFGLLDALAVAEKMNCLPEEIVVVGVEPGEVSFSLELTKPVKQSIPKVIKEVLEEIKDDIHRE